MGVPAGEIWKQSKVLGEGNLIFVTIGLMYGFDRLVKEMDRIAEWTEEGIIIQIGKTAYVPKNATYFRFRSKEEMNVLYENSRIVVCHAGVGSILSALEHGKPVIAVPRRKEYGEVIDEHQIEISRELEKENRITVVNDVSKLESVLANITAGSSVNIKMDSRLAKALKGYIDGLNR